MIGYEQLDFDKNITGVFKCQNTQFDTPLLFIGPLGRLYAWLLVLLLL